MPLVKGDEKVKQLNITIPENAYVLSAADIDLIHAMAFYFANESPEDVGMTKQAHKLVCKLEEQFRLSEAKGSLKVWE